MKVLLIIDVIGFIVYWFNFFVLLGKIKDYQKNGHNKRKIHLSVLTKILDYVKFILYSFIPVFNLIIGLIFANKKVINGVIKSVFED